MPRKYEFLPLDEEGVPIPWFLTCPKGTVVILPKRDWDDFVARKIVIWRNSIRDQKKAFKNKPRKLIQKPEDKVCVECNKIFTPYKSKQIYCSARCRNIHLSRFELPKPEFIQLSLFPLGIGQYLGPVKGIMHEEERMS